MKRPPCGSEVRRLSIQTRECCANSASQACPYLHLSGRCCYSGRVFTAKNKVPAQAKLKGF